MRTNRVVSRLLAGIFMILALSLSVMGQETGFAQAGPSGIFVGLGKYVPCGIRVSAYKVERSSAGSDWRLLSESKAPVSFEEFLAKAEESKSLFSGNSVPPEDKMKSIWLQGTQNGFFEAKDAWSVSIPVKMAMGMIFLDKAVKEDIKYKYRVTALSGSGEVIEQNTSAEVSWPVVPAFDSPVLVAVDLQPGSLFLKWMSAGKNPAPAFRVYGFENEKPTLMTGKTVVYMKRDTAWYLYTDKTPSVLACKDPAFFMVQVDSYENQGKPGQVVMAGTDFSSVSFLKTRAVRESRMPAVTVYWKLSDPQKVKVVEVYRSLDPDKDFSLISAVAPTDTSFTDPGIIPDKIQYYYLRATGSYGFQQVKSNTVFEFGLDTRPPATPAIVKSEGIRGGTELTVVLNDTFIAGIRVFRSDGQSDSLRPIGDLIRCDSGSVVFRDTSAALNGHLYYRYAVKSENTSHLLSDFSNVVFLRPLKPTVPDPPVSFTAYLENKAVRLLWDNGGELRKYINGYRVYRKEEPGKPTEAKPEICLAGEDKLLVSNYFTDSTTVAGKSYTYQVRVVDINGFVSRYNAIATVDIPSDRPIPPAGLKAINTPEGVVLEWGPAAYENLSMYRIYRYQRGAEPQVIKLTAKTQTTYTDTSVQKDQLYFYYLTTVDKSDQESDPCDEVSVMH